MRTKSRAEAHNRLFELSQYLQLLNQTKDLISKNGSWVFDQIEVPNEPAEIQEDLQGTVTYSMDVAVFIYKQRGVF
ncbi:Minor capsid protein from bacteriophage [Chlamydia trachomatis]|nr:Minor capsid protein from bacteriophage [Chlamydia trachomatis]